MTIVDKVFEVFSKIATWFTTTLPSLSEMFYAEGELTLIGVMTVAGVGISVALLLFNYVKDLISFR